MIVTMMTEELKKKTFSEHCQVVIYENSFLLY